jgi:hypothetical protein
MTKYSEITDTRIQTRVRTRYAAEIAALQELGFRCLAFKQEARGPFSALLYLPVLPLMIRAKEVLVFPFPLRLALANILFVHSDLPAIACCMGLGVKFYTNFSDGCLLISSTLESHVALQDPALQNLISKIIRTPPVRSVNQAWLSHRNRVTELAGIGKKVGNTASVADYVQISDREEADLRHAQSALP